MGQSDCKCQSCPEECLSKQTVARITFPYADRILEDNLLKLFTLHDLNKNGVLEEAELVQLNKKIALLHHGNSVDIEAVKAKYQDLFRSKLDEAGAPVSYFVFRKYMLEVLDRMDGDKVSQKMILEHFIVEASLARAAFHNPRLHSDSDAPFVAMISFDEGCPPPERTANSLCPSTLPKLSRSNEEDSISESCFPRAVGGDRDGQTWQASCAACGYSPRSSQSTCRDSNESGFTVSLPSTSRGDSDSEVIPGSPSLSYQGSSAYL